MTKAPTTRRTKKVQTKRAPKAEEAVKTTVVPTNMVHKLLKLNEQIAKLNEQKNILAQKVFDKFGETSVVVPMEKPTESKSFARVSLTDNVNRLKKGETIFKSAGFSQIEIGVSFLKNEPKK